VVEAMIRKRERKQERKEKEKGKERAKHSNEDMVDDDRFSLYENLLEYEIKRTLSHRSGRLGRLFSEIDRFSPQPTRLPCPSEIDRFSPQPTRPSRPSEIDRLSSKPSSGLFARPSRPSEIDSFSS